MKKWNIELRKTVVDDCNDIYRIRNQSRVWLHDDREFTLSDVVAWFEKTNPDWYSIILDGSMVGYFRISNWSQKDRSLYIGADIDEEKRGMGIGKEAYLKMLPTLFLERKLHQISLEVLSNNKRAISLYNKLGFVSEGKRSRSIWREEDGWIDSILMTLTRNRYMELYSETFKPLENFTKILTPCVGICKLKETSCLSCGRTREEIKLWIRYTDKDRLSIISELDNRNHSPLNED